MPKIFQIISHYNIPIETLLTYSNDDLSNDDNYDAKGWFVRINGKY